MKRLLVAIVILFALGIGLYLYFVNTFKEPVFLSIRDLKVIRQEGNLAEISAIAVFDNPNDLSATLLNTELKAYSNDVQVGFVSQTNITDIPPAARFEVPFRLTVDLLKLGMSQSISGLVEKLINEERDLPIRFEGYCRIKNGETNYKIPVTYEDKLRFK